MENFVCPGFAQSMFGGLVYDGHDREDRAGEKVVQVGGVTNEELRDSAYAMVLGERKVRVQMPEPIALLKAKIANVADLGQNGRQDARHVAMPAHLAAIWMDPITPFCCPPILSPPPPPAAKGRPGLAGLTTARAWRGCLLDEALRRLIGLHPIVVTSMGAHSRPPEKTSVYTV